MDGTLSRVPLTYRIGEVTLGSVRRRMLVCNFRTFESREAPDDEGPRIEELPPGVDGVLLRSVPVSGTLPRIHVSGGIVRYVPRQYDRYYADLSTSYEDYLQSFSRKSRSTLRRKVRSFEKESGGEIQWRCYRTPAEIEEFYRLARGVSEESYQERLLDVGLPAEEEFVASLRREASEDNVRGYLIFMDAEAVAYLYCPIRDGVVLYSHLGYRSGCERLSPGTVLLWLAIQSLFEEGGHRVFDFAEGGDASKHSQKRLFSTGSVRCADVYFFDRTLTNVTIVASHSGLESAAESAGRALTKLGVKRGLKRVTRRLATLRRGS